MSFEDKPSCSKSSSARSKHSSRVAAQTSADARINAEFNKSEPHFDYIESTGAARMLCRGDNSVMDSSVSSYLQRMQRERLIQPFGCLIAVEESTFAIIAYSENAAEMLDLTPHAVPSMEQKGVLTIGMDARSLFTLQGVATLQKAASFDEVNLLNPILVNCRNHGKPFYAIVHRIDVGLVIDLEPVNLEDVPVTAPGALKSYKLAAKSISRLQSLPSGDINLLCDVLVRELSDLMGYDRVMAYKFHEDEHGEVIAECRKPDLESYLGLHYPATDIPQASRFLFMKNKVRIICDCTAAPVKVIQDKKLDQPLNLGNSTLRAPHSCHAQYMANMGSIASLVLSVTINEDGSDYLINRQQQRRKKLWGLVVCHHTSPRFVPFPLRYACEFLIQVFGIQLNKEVELAAQARENRLLQLQAVLCDMLLRDAPVGIITQSPNVMDVVKCDGAALYYQNQIWALGITPSDVHIREIALWISKHHDGTTGLSTDSLMEAGYPYAAELGDSVCGIAAIKLTSKDFMFWFRSHAAKEIKWGGAKSDSHVEDGMNRTMHPRSSFNAFLEVTKQRSVPWEDVEMDAIHSLQLILRASLKDDTANDKSKNVLDTICNHSRNFQCIDELRTVATEMFRVIETAAVPILAIDTSGHINGWNMKVAELTGLPVQQAIGKPLLDLVDDTSVEIIKHAFILALQGKEERSVEFKLKRFNLQKYDSHVLVVANACCSRDSMNNIVGISFVAQDVTGEKKIMDRYARIQGDYTAIIKNPSSLIPPVFMVDERGFCVEWNAAMQKISGLKREDVMDKILIGEVFNYQCFGCRVMDINMLTRLKIVISSTIAGQETDILDFSFFDKNGNCVDTLLSSSMRTTLEGRITGAVCFLHVIGPEQHHILRLQKMSEQDSINGLRELAYIREEIKRPLHGIMFLKKLLECTTLSLEQKQILQRSFLCQEQLAQIIEGVDILKDEERSFVLSNAEFNLGEALETVKLQVLNASMERQIPLIYDISEEVSSIYLYGDNLRLQQILSDFLSNALQFTHSSMGSVMLQLTAGREYLESRAEIVHLDFRITHPAPGIPEIIVQEMFRHKEGSTREGLGLHISQKLVKLMSGAVQYLRDDETSSFAILVKFPLVRWAIK